MNLPGKKNIILDRKKKLKATLNEDVVNFDNRLYLKSLLWARCTLIRPLIKEDDRSGQSIWSDVNGRQHQVEVASNMRPYECTSQMGCLTRDSPGLTAFWQNSPVPYHISTVQVR